MGQSIGDGALVSFVYLRCEEIKVQNNIKKLQNLLILKQIKTSSQIYSKNKRK